MKEIIEIKNVYTIKEARANMPFTAETCYHVVVTHSGYLHDVGMEIILTPIKNGEEPTGWNTFNSDFIKEVKEIKELWKLNDNYGYH